MAHTIYRSADGRAAVAEWCHRAYRSWTAAHRIIEVPTRRGATHGVVAGAGRRPVVLLPGTNLATATWLELLTLLATEQRVVALDLPGQAGLTAAGRPTSAADGGRWLRDALAALDVDAPLVVAHAAGARIALAAATLGVVGGAVLIAPAGLMRERRGMSTISATVPWLTRSSTATATAMLQEMVGPVSRVPPHLVDWMVLVGRHARPRLITGRLPDDAVHRVEVPVTVVAGTHDPFLPRLAWRRATDRLAGARVEIVDGAGHLLPHERPDAVATAVRQMQHRLTLP